MLQLSALHKTFGARILFDSVTWKVQTGDRVGLCGPNGAGKTTLLKMLARIEEPDSGTISHPADLTVGYLPQDGLSHSNRTLFEETSTAFEHLLSLQAEMRKLETNLGDSSVSSNVHEQMLSRYSEVQEIFRHHDGYDIESRVSAVLLGLGFKTSDFRCQTDTFSGGWQMRIAMAKLLLRRPSLLLMDEPTNHLDLDARNWLEDFLVTYPNSVVLVSHDRFFLDSVVTTITEINHRTLITYPGNYSAYLVKSDIRLKKLKEQKRRQDEGIAKLQAFIDRFRYNATKAAQVQSRVKMLKKIELIEAPAERKRVHFKFPTVAKSGRTVLELNDIRKSYGELTVLNKVNVHIERGDRIALIGPNGVGKSTLMRLLAGVEAPDRGTRTEGKNVQTQYFAQDEAMRLNEASTVYETLIAGSPMRMVPAIRNILGGFLFEDEDVNKRVKVLSGGERTRLAVAKMLLKPSNTLLLDEPTNHLDIDSTNVLLDALLDYGGTLIFVSHDRHFVDQLATKVLKVSNGGVMVYPGTYEEYRWSIQQRTQTLGKSTKKIQEKSPSSNQYTAHRHGQLEARKQQRKLRALQDRITDLEHRISKREEEVRKLEKVMAEPSFYSDERKSKDTIDKHQKLMWEVGDLMNQWEGLQKE